MKVVLNFLLAYGFEIIGLSLKIQIYVELVIVQRFSLMYLAETLIRTRFYASLGMKFFIQRSS